MIDKRPSWQITLHRALMKKSHYHNLCTSDARKNCSIPGIPPGQRSDSRLSRMMRRQISLQRLRHKLGVRHEALRALDGDLRLFQCLFAHPHEVVGAREVLSRVFSRRIVVVVIVVGGGGAGGCAPVGERRCVTEFHFDDSGGNGRMTIRRDHVVTGG